MFVWSARATGILAASLQIFYLTWSFLNFITIINIIVVFIQMGRKACTKNVFKLLIIFL